MSDEMKEVLVKKPLLDNPRYFAGSDGNIYNSAGRRLRPAINLQGYQTVSPCNGSRKSQKSNRVHFLVCEAFHGKKPSPLHQVRHLDGNQLNNAPWNLKWGTHAENLQDQIRHGGFRKGEKHHSSKLTDAERAEIMRLSKDGKTGVWLAKTFKISTETISRIIQNVPPRRTCSHSVWHRTPHPLGKDMEFCKRCSSEKPAGQNWRRSVLVPDTKLTDSQIMEFDPFNGTRSTIMRTVSIVKTKRNHPCGMATDHHFVIKGERARFDQAIVGGHWTKTYTCLKCVELNWQPQPLPPNPPKKGDGK